MKNLYNVLVLLILFIVPGCSTSYNVGLRLENDIVGDADKNYTHGSFIQLSADAEKVAPSVKKVALFLPTFRVYDSDPEDLTRVKIELGQEIHTPDDLREEAVIETDNPYAGFLYGKLSRVNATPVFSTDTGLVIGVVGPHSYAGVVQTFVHDDLDCGTHPAGWKNQLEEEPIINLEHSRRWVDFFSSWASTISQLRFRVGNAHTDITYSNGFRIGYNTPSLDGSHSDKVSAYYFGTVHIDAVGRNIFYDGNTWKDSHKVTTKHAVGRVDTGVVVGYQGYSVKFNVTGSSKQFEEQEDDYSIYGGIILGIDW